MDLSGSGMVQGLNVQQRLHLRRAIIDLLLSTDMSKHFSKVPPSPLLRCTRNSKL